MAILIPGQSICRFCGLTLSSGQKTLSFPAFLPKDHPLYPYSDGSFHLDCFKKWPQHEQFQNIYEVFRSITSNPPKNLVGGKEIDKWASDARAEYLRRIASVAADGGKRHPTA